MKPQSASTSKVAVSLLILTVVMAALFIKPTVQYVEAGGNEVNRSTDVIEKIEHTDESVQIEDEEQAEDEVIKTEQKEVDGKVLGTGGQYVQSYQEVIDDDGNLVKVVVKYQDGSSDSINE